MFINLCIILLLIKGRCETRSISFVVKHQEFFAVQDVEERGHIPLSDSHERQLELTDLSENDVKIQDNVSPSSKDTVGADNVHGNYAKDHRMLNKDHFNTEDDEYRHRDDYNDDIDDDDEDDDEVYGTKLDDFHNVETLPSIYSKSDDVNHNEFDIESISGLKKILRRKRSAHEQWKNSLPGANKAETTEDTKPDVWEEVSDEELQKAQRHKYKQIAIYAGWTLLSVFFFVFVGICFLRDPVACIFAFGTGCPCCLICCPCVRAFTDKYLDTKKIMREQMNKYMPGVIVNDDGTLERYEPTPDELDTLAELIDELSE
ncbi:uncharacterized protein LOC123542303 [Mercenaria mercenaria]|uniref:uncharacterized protein LOC123542303 n=1 Tax=Mercenaria mercenaria TaxID=6596 RepID=UPI00234E935F|nr:uncharacterized protein LOC123542303 [Mercenaria mercenaria]